MPIEVIKIDNTTTYAHKHGNIGWETTIPLPDMQSDLVVKFNPTSTLYNEDNFMSKEEFEELGLEEKDNEPNYKGICKPPVYNNIWRVSEWTYKRKKTWWWGMTYAIYIEENNAQEI
jgi:hypothetical protein